MSRRLRVATSTGCVGGVIMMACLMVGATRAGVGWDSPLRWIVAFLGAEPTLIEAGQAQGGISVPTIIAFGLAIHFATAIAFAWLLLRLMEQLRGLFGWRLAAAGLVYGAAVWVIMTLVALRLFDDVMYARVQIFLPQTFFAAHLLFGAALAACASLTREESASPIPSPYRGILNLREDQPT